MYHGTLSNSVNLILLEPDKGRNSGFFFSDDPTCRRIWVNTKYRHTIYQNPFTGDYSNYKGIKGGTSFSAYQKIREALIKDGYDGIITKKEGGDGEYIAFFPEQIKSIHNQGTFNPQDPNIYHQNQRPRAQVRYTPNAAL